MSAKTAGLGKLSTNFDFEVFSPHPKEMSSSNNSSLVVRIAGRADRGFSYLVTGDTENDRWTSINDEFGERLASSVMAAPHHGARNATNAKTLHLVSPNTILISAGVDNQYGHPDRAVVQAYVAIAKHVFATCTDGGCSLHTSLKNGDFRTIPFVE